MSLVRSKRASWWSMILMVLVIIIVICTRVVSSIWEYSVLFLAFMAVFCHLMSFLLLKMSPKACKKLDSLAGFFGGLAVIALIVVFILDFIAVS